MNDDRKQALSQEELARMQGGGHYRHDDLTDPPERAQVRKPFGSSSIQLSEGELSGVRGGGSVLPSAGGGIRLGGEGDRPNDRRDFDLGKGGSIT